MGVKERLIEFLDQVPISQNKFEKKVGLGNGFVNNIGDSIRKNSMDKITKIYPELNTSWLLTGVGEMKSGHTLQEIIEITRKEVTQIQATILSITERLISLEEKVTKKSGDAISSDVQKRTEQEVKRLQGKVRKG